VDAADCWEEVRKVNKNRNVCVTQTSCGASAHDLISPNLSDNQHQLWMQDTGLMMFATTYPTCSLCVVATAVTAVKTDLEFDRIENPTAEHEATGELDCFRWAAFERNHTVVHLEEHVIH